MKQPVSRNSFDHLLGYVGAYLHEGAPFIDALWNESVDIQWSLLRDAVRDAGLEGTAGIELRIDPVDADAGGLPSGFVARGGPGRFYCGGLPILWPDSRLIDVRPDESAPRGGGEQGDEWTQTVWLEAWVGPVDSLEAPDLDDPGLGTERGSFRTRVHSRIRVVRPHKPRTDLLLTIRGSYGADRNVLYRVEIVGVRDHSASLVWDSAGASVTALVTGRAEAGATRVTLGNTEGFEVGHYIQFEGEGVDQALYRVTGRDADALDVQQHDCQDKLAPKGLVEAIDPWDPEYAAPLALTAHSFRTFLEVERPVAAAAQQVWEPGMHVQIRTKAGEAAHTMPIRFVDTESGRSCRPGDDTVQSDEIRRVVRIVHHQRGACGEGRGATMTLVLDEPLSYEHWVGAMVIPGRKIRVRRFEGHACEVPIDVVNPSSAPSPDEPSSPYDGGGRQPLISSGLSLMLAFEHGGEDHACPVGVRGDGWTFAARAGGWVERPVFAPVDEDQRACSPLAQIRWGKESCEVIDMRPVPAPHAQHGWLADIADTADEIDAAGLADRAARVAESARRAEGMRAQRGLVNEIRALVEELSGKFGDRPVCARACANLDRAVRAVNDAEIPTAAELSRIASAMERLSTALFLASRPHEPDRVDPVAPQPDEGEPPPVLDVPTAPPEDAPPDESKPPTAVEPPTSLPAEAPPEAPTNPPADTVADEPSSDDNRGEP